MSASSKDTNPYKKGDRVILKDPTSFLNGYKGTVSLVNEHYMQVLLSNGVNVITKYQNFNKLKKK